MKTVFRFTIFILLILLLEGCKAKDGDKFEKTTQKIADYRIDSLLFEDDFNTDLSEWKIETDTTHNTKVAIKKGKLVIDVDCGATVWLNRKLSGNVIIEYDRKVLVEGRPNDRLSDLNQFWMANDPANTDLFTRNGTFNQYHELALYYFGIGGNTNSTSRMRKYVGTGERFLINDLSAEQYLLEPNITYHIKTTVYNGKIEVFVNNKKYFSYFDKSAYTSGYFGFRTTQSRQQIDNLKIYRIK